MLLSWSRLYSQSLADSVSQEGIYQRGVCVPGEAGAGAGAGGGGAGTCVSV